MQIFLLTQDAETGQNKTRVLNTDSTSSVSTLKSQIAPLFPSASDFTLYFGHKSLTQYGPEATLQDFNIQNNSTLNVFCHILGGRGRCGRSRGHRARRCHRGPRHHGRVHRTHHVGIHHTGIHHTGFHHTGGVVRTRIVAVLTPAQQETNRLQNSSPGALEAEALKAGWLQKVSGVWPFKIFKKKWCIMTTRYIIWFDSPGSTKPAGLIKLNEKAIRAPTVGKAKFSFVITRDSFLIDEDWKFIASDTSDRDEWIKLINDARNAQNPTATNANPHLTQDQARQNANPQPNLNNNNNNSIGQTNTRQLRRKETLSYLLPHGWEAAVDAQGRTFYIDHNTKTTTYQDPRARGHGSEPDQMHVPQQQQQALPPHIEVQRDSNGRVYYIDHQNQTTSYEPPQTLLQHPHTPIANEFHPPQHVFHPQQQPSSPWTHHFDAQGRPFWYNTQTGQSSYADPFRGPQPNQAPSAPFEDPANQSEWERKRDPQGRAYLVNRKTGGSSYNLKLFNQ